VLGTDEALLIDTGARGSWILLASGLASVGVSPTQVSLVTLTHSHPDHCGDLYRVVQETCALVAVHVAEADFVSGKELAPNPFTRPVQAGLIQPFLPLLYGKPVKVNHRLENDDLLPFSRKVQVVHTPGHTPGSICFFLPDSRLLVVGDILEYRFGRLRPPMDAVTQDPKQARASLKKLLGLDFDLMCFGHFRPIQEGARAALRQLVESIDQEAR
jgi:glyoxylase-like metal-dependent hydrolase (beta-lactamase superfamily II)